MESIKDKLDQIELQLKVLIDHYELIKKENLALKQEVNILTARLKLGKNDGEEVEQQTLQLKIDQCITAINECITLIENG